MLPEPIECIAHHPSSHAPAHRAEEPASPSRASELRADPMEIDEISRPARIERDVYADFLHRLAPLEGPEADQARLEARERWFERFDNASVQSTLYDLGYRYGENPEIAAAIDHANERIPGDVRPHYPPYAKYHENQYGRNFETAFAYRLLEHPTPAARQAAVKQFAFLQRDALETLDALPESMQYDFVDTLARHMSNDRRQWAQRAKQIDGFTHDPNAETLGDLFAEPQNGHDIMAGQYAAVKLGQALAATGLAPRWMETANTMYAAVKSNRSTEDVREMSLTASPGINLANQARMYPPPGYGYAFSWSDARMPHFDEPTDFEIHAFFNGHSVVSGASGSANILGSLNAHIAAADPSFDVDAAALNTLSFLVNDGGHSFNEVMAVHKAIAPRLSQTVTQQVVEEYFQAIRDHDFEFRDVTSLPSDKESRDQLTVHMEQALDETIATFGQFGYRVPSSNNLQAMASDDPALWND